MKDKKIVGKIIDGVLNVLIVLFALFLLISMYTAIQVKIFKNEYSNVTYHMADSASMYVNGDHIDEYLDGVFVDFLTKSGLYFFQLVFHCLNLLACKFLNAENVAQNFVVFVDVLKGR